MIVLGIALNSKFTDYETWVKKADSCAEVVQLSHERQNLNDLDGCDGLILTGGSDIHPRFYGCEDARGLVEPTNESRDEFELAVVRRGIEGALPTLGICRGLQVFNVARSGTLIQHIGDGIHRVGKGIKADTRHCIEVVSGSVMHSIAGTTNGEVNSHHHQAVDRTGNGLRVTARSNDGLIEGLEWEDPAGKPFLLLVQWHPERMEDFESPFSRGLCEHFLREVRASKSVQTSP
jgi:putative glutamine amidotransferase